MLSRCLSCYTRFPANQTLERLQHGRRVAFDPARGRLWAVCAACSRWTLAPMETRWETLEELERCTRSGARLLKQGENIALLMYADLEIIRIGTAQLREEVWWRYGAEFMQRQARAQVAVRRGKMKDALLWTTLLGIPIWRGDDVQIDRARRDSFGRNSWRGLSFCSRCNRSLSEIRFADRPQLYLASEGATLQLWYPCDRCGMSAGHAGHRFTGVVAEHVLRRTLAYENFAGGSAAVVQQALSTVGRFESPHIMLMEAAARRAAIGRLTHHDALAIEIALNSALEAVSLEQELSTLELRWREEEQLAAIIDGELTPLSPRLK